MTSPKAATYRDALKSYQSGDLAAFSYVGNSIGQGSFGAGYVYISNPSPLGSPNIYDSRIRGHVNQVRDLMRQKNPSNEFWNPSVSGWTLDDHILHGTIAKLAALSPKPSLVFIACQLNEAGLNWTMTHYLASLHAVIDQVIAAGMVPVLVRESMRMAAPDLWYNAAGENDYTFSAQQPLVALEYGGLGVVDFTTPFYDNFQAYGAPFGETGLPTYGELNTDPPMNIESPHVWIYNPDNAVEPYSGASHPNPNGCDAMAAILGTWINQNTTCPNSAYYSPRIKNIDGSPAGIIKSFKDNCWQ